MAKVVGIKTLKSIPEGIYLISASTAVSLGSDLINDDEDSDMDKGAQLQQAIEAKHIRAMAYNGNVPLYNMTDLGASID